MVKPSVENAQASKTDWPAGKSLSSDNNAAPAAGVATTSSDAELAVGMTLTPNAAPVVVSLISIRCCRLVSNRGYRPAAPEAVETVEAVNWWVPAFHVPPTG